jgi:DNA primase
MNNIDNILQLDIVQVISQYIDLKKAGANYKANCPFHGEKTPSFVVSHRKQIFKCFGCGESGNLISFVQKHLNLSFPDTLKEIAKNNNIQLEFKPQTESEMAEEKKSESMFVLYNIANKHFIENLYKTENALILEYALSRFNLETLQTFGLGYSLNSWDGLLKHLNEKQVKKDFAIESGLIKESEKNGKLYDFFRNRLQFPIHDRYGRVIAYSGRTTNKEEKAKYINSQESIIYDKSKTLYGLNLAYSAIRTKEFAYLVEGNPDVMRMHEKGYTNTVGTCGTSLTPFQIEELRKYTNSITIIFDGDKAGFNATIRSGRMIIEKGLFCNVVILPDGQDPDTFLINKCSKDFNQFIHENQTDYIVFYANYRKEKATNNNYRTKLINELANLIANSPQDSIDLYIDQVGAIIKPKKAIKDKVNSILKNVVKEDNKKGSIPEHVKLSDFEQYGFYDDSNSYYFKTAKGTIKGSNFTMQPLFHVENGDQSKRLYRIKNIDGIEKLVEFDQADLISLAKFQLKVESLGNFIFQAGLPELFKLKAFLYAETKTAKLVDQLGYNKDGFFSWSNGIFNGKFSQLNEVGIVNHKEQNYYIPSRSNIYSDQEELFVSEKKFQFVPGELTNYDYSFSLVDIYGFNGMIAYSYLIASLFRDIIFKKLGYFPMLNLFGLKGSGKTFLGYFLIKLFGSEQIQAFIPNSTIPALANNISQTKNAVILLDEYKNNLDPQKIEFLKGLWNSVGRTRMNMDKDKKNETSKVDTGLIIAGQEKPTIDIALFSRMIYLQFKQVEFTNLEKKAHEDFYNKIKKGAGNIVHDIIKYRDYFKENFNENYEMISLKVNELLNGYIIEDRVKNNWTVVLAAFYTINGIISTAIDFEILLDMAIDQIKVQNDEMKQSNEVGNFWKIFQFLVDDGHIIENADFKVNNLEKLKTDTINRSFDKPRSILMIYHSRIIPLYRKQGKQMGETILPSDSLDYYLKNDPAYLGKKLSERFHKIDPKTGIHLTNEQGQKQYKISTCYCFDLDKMPLNLKIEEEHI